VQRDVTLDFIKPEKPAQHVYTERFNSAYREDVLDAYIFDSIQEAQTNTEKQLEDYSSVHTHDALVSLPPYQFKAIKSLNIALPPGNKNGMVILIIIRI
jgi:putative transposase